MINHTTPFAFTTANANIYSIYTYIYIYNNYRFILAGPSTDVVLSILRVGIIPAIFIIPQAIRYSIHIVLFLKVTKIMESSLPEHGRTRLGDKFNEDETELQFLRSKPTCFIIIGKPGCGKSTLSKRLSQLWRCELVHGTQLIQNEIEIGTEAGKKMQETLMKGEALSSGFVMGLIRFGYLDRDEIMEYF